MVFAVAAGPRVGFGHLVRCRSLARALGVPPIVVLRATAATRRRAAAAGWRIVSPDRPLERLAPGVLVVDDPSAVAVRAWVHRARRAGIPVATIHDLGIAAIDSDLAIDGTVRPHRRIGGRVGTLHGPAYAILDPSVRAARDELMPQAPARVLIALGGGAQARTAARIARAIAERVDAVDIRVAGGFVAAARPVLARGHWIEAPQGLAAELARATVAVVAGGVTLYEACALGVPAIAVALNPAQHVTVRGIAQRGAAIDATGSAARTARLVQELLGDRAARRRLRAAGRRLVDGRGAFRVAERIRALPALVARGMSDVA